MLDVYQEMLPNCVRLLVPVEEKTEVKGVPFVQSSAIVTEILTMTCIAVERHQGIVHPLKMKWQYTNKRAFTMLGKILSISSNSVCREIIFSVDGMAEQKALI